MKAAWYQLQRVGFKVSERLNYNAVSSGVYWQADEKVTTIVYNRSGEISVCSTLNWLFDEQDW